VVITERSLRTLVGATSDLEILTLTLTLTSTLVPETEKSHKLDARGISDVDWEIVAQL